MGVIISSRDNTNKHSSQIKFMKLWCSQVTEGKVTALRIDEARELYRPAAQRAALLYFVLNDLHHINPVYQFSLKVSSGHNMIFTLLPLELNARVCVRLHSLDL
jgi:hypothetical protein